MKRSQINNAIKHAMAMLEAESLKLPEFAYWSIEQWREKKDELANLKKVMLGWDVTDFGLDDFHKEGATLFTIRNGDINDLKAGTPYAEKLIFLTHEQEQEITYHFHRVKTEDIINRGGGILVLQLYNSTPEGKLDEVSDIHVKMDGIIRTLPAGAVVEIEKGNSITIEPGLFHRFFAKQGHGDLIIGEVSSINDDRADNVFLIQSHRYVQVVEDEEILYPLCNEYHIL